MIHVGFYRGEDSMTRRLLGANGEMRKALSLFKRRPIQHLLKERSSYRQSCDDGERIGKQAKEDVPSEDGGVETKKEQRN
jgi:hypothetical protein